jgi:hypothetical protein
LGGSPADGHLAAATVNASWTASSAASMSPRKRISVATQRPYSRRKTASTVTRESLLPVHGWGYRASDAKASASSSSPSKKESSSSSALVECEQVLCHDGSLPSAIRGQSLAGPHSRYEVATAESTLRPNRRRWAPGLDSGAASRPRFISGTAIYMDTFQRRRRQSITGRGACCSLAIHLAMRCSDGARAVWPLA